MRLLRRYFESPFESRNISLPELLAFATDHLERMVTDNPGGALDGRIAATSAALHALAQCAGDDQIKLGVRQARKSAKDAFRAGLAEPLRRVQGALEAAFGIGSAPVLEAFPWGRSVFSQCADDQLASHLEPLRVVVTSQAAALPGEIVTLMNELVTRWAAVHAESESATGAKAAQEAQKRAARSALQRELYLNLVRLMELFPMQVDKLEFYMQQHLLEDHPRRARRAAEG